MGQARLEIKESKELYFADNKKKLVKDAKLCLERGALILERYKSYMTKEDENLVSSLNAGLQFRQGKVYMSEALNERLVNIDNELKRKVKFEQNEIIKNQIEVLEKRKKYTNKALRNYRNETKEVDEAIKSDGSIDNVFKNRLRVEQHLLESANDRFETICKSFKNELNFESDVRSLVECAIRFDVLFFTHSYTKEINRLLESRQKSNPYDVEGFVTNDENNSCDTQLSERPKNVSELGETSGYYSLTELKVNSYKKGDKKEFNQMSFVDILNSFVHSDYSLRGKRERLEAFGYFMIGGLVYSTMLRNMEILLNHLEDAPERIASAKNFSPFLLTYITMPDFNVNRDAVEDYTDICKAELAKLYDMKHPIETIIEELIKDESNWSF